MLILIIFVFPVPIPGAVSNESHVSINKCENLNIYDDTVQAVETKMEIIFNKPTQFGDSPIWFQRRQSLYCTNFFGEIYNLYRFDDRNEKIYCIRLEFGQNSRMLHS